MAKRASAAKFNWVLTSSDEDPFEAGDLEEILWDSTEKEALDKLKKVAAELEVHTVSLFKLVPVASAVYKEPEIKPEEHVKVVKA